MFTKQLSAYGVKGREHRAWGTGNSTSPYPLLPAPCSLLFSLTRQFHPEGGTTLGVIFRKNIAVVPTDYLIGDI